MLNNTALVPDYLLDSFNLLRGTVDEGLFNLVIFC